MRRDRHRSTMWVVPLLLLLAVSARAQEPDPLPDDRARARISVEPDTKLYGDTGRLSMAVTIHPTMPLPMRCRVLLHLVVPKTGDILIDTSHVPATRSTRWEEGRAVTYRIDTVVPAEEDGSRPALVILAGLVDPPRENGFEGRLILEGEDLFGDRRYLVARVETAKPVVRTVEGLLARAAELEGKGQGAAAFHVREEAMAVASDMRGKILVTAALLAQPPFTADPVTATEQVRMERHIAGEKLRYLRDRASGLLRKKEYKLALRVMERIGGVAEEERNTRVAGDPSGVKRVQKDIVDLQVRLLALPKDEEKDYKEAVEKAEGDPRRLMAAAQKAKKRGRLHLARALLKEILYTPDIPQPVKDKATEMLGPIETSILRDLTPAQEKRLAGEMDHPAFNRLGSATSGRFVLLGPEAMVKSIPVPSRHRFDVASLLLTDLLGRSAVAPGDRVIVFWKETWDFGGATAGGSIINVGRANPDARGTRVDTGLFYHEFTHCVDDTRPVHRHKGGLTEGIANTGAIFVHDMFAGETGQFARLSRAPLKAFKRYYLDRDEAFWLIPGYDPSAGFLLEILTRHAPGPTGHPDWTALGRFFREYRRIRAKSPRTHRIMAYIGLALERAMGPEVWTTLAEFRFPVDSRTSAEMARLNARDELTLQANFHRGGIQALLALADEAEPGFVAARARYGALALLDRLGRGDGERAAGIRRTLGVIEKFHVIGPFYGKTGEPLAEVFPPERELDLKKEYVTAGDVARWRVPGRRANHYAKMDGRGVVRLEYGYPDNAVTYALAHVTVPEAVDAMAWLGADDEVALEVNGAFVQLNRGRRALWPDFERWPIRLRAGRNRILVKIRNLHGSTGYSLRVTDPDGRPIPRLVTDLEPPREADAPPPPKVAKWQTILEDVYRRRSLGRKYEIAAGSFRIRNKVLRGEPGKGRAGWRPFSVRPGMPQDYPHALAWLCPKAREIPADFEWRIRLEKPGVPKIVLTWDGEGDRETLSGWSLIVLPHKNGKIFDARLERYDVPRTVARLPVPEKWDEPVLLVRRVDGRVTVTLGGSPIFDNVSAPPLTPRRFGIGLWGHGPGLVGTLLAIPR
jgi:hypothetical protein